MYITVYAYLDDVIIASYNPKTKEIKYYRMEEIESETDSNATKSLATEISQFEWEIIKTKFEKVYETDEHTNFFKRRT